MYNLSKIAASLGVVAMPTAYITTSNCFKLQGTYSNGTRLGYLQVSGSDWSVWADISQSCCTRNKTWHR